MQATHVGSSSIEAAIEMNRSTAPRAPEHVETLSRARSNLYLLIAVLLRKAPDAALISDLGKLRGDPSPLGMAQLALANAARATTVEAAGREHFNLFIGVGRGEVLPYASFYLTGFLNERPLAELRDDMARLGIERRTDVFEPEDHLGCLLEIMAGLIRGDFGQSTDADAFFVRHIARWSTRALDDIEVSPSAKFYRSVAQLGRVWLDIEREAMKLPNT